MGQEHTALHMHTQRDPKHLSRLKTSYCVCACVCIFLLGEIKDYKDVRTFEG